MRIDTTKLGVVQSQYFQSSMNKSSSKLLTNMRLKPDVDTFALSPKTEEIFFTYGFKIDKNNQKELQSFGSWEEFQGQISLNKWKERKEQYGDDSFSVYADAQHLVFAQKLQEMGVFDGKSEEEINKMKDLLFNITSMMSCVGEDKLGASYAGTESRDRYYCYEGKLITMQRYDESLYGITSDVAKVGLESAKAALEEFGSRYLTQDQQGEFSGLIDEFYNHNAEYLKEYRAFGEDVSKFAANFQKLGLRDIYDQKGLIGIHEMFENGDDEYTRMLSNMNHTQEETDNYIKRISAMFKLIRQTGSNFADIWNQKNPQMQDNILNQSASAFTHMEGYWSELLQG